MKYLPTTETDEEQKELAKEIATAFNDTKRISLYLHYCKKYPLEIVREVFDIVQNTPNEKIKKSPAALFTHLLKHENK